MKWCEDCLIELVFANKSLRWTWCICAELVRENWSPVNSPKEIFSPIEIDWNNTSKVNWKDLKIFMTFSFKKLDSNSEMCYALQSFSFRNFGEIKLIDHLSVRWNNKKTGRCSFKIWAECLIFRVKEIENCSITMLKLNFFGRM